MKEREDSITVGKKHLKYEAVIREKNNYSRFSTSNLDISLVEFALRKSCLK